MKKEILKSLKAKTRKEQGPVPPTRVVPNTKSYKRKKKHPKTDEDGAV
jgi:hypothetical protein